MKQERRSRPRRAKVDRGFELQPGDIRVIRQKLGKSQVEFALMIGVSVATLQNWEQGRRKPVGPAQVLLKIAALRPQIVVQVLGSGQTFFDMPDPGIGDAMALSQGITRILSRMATA